MWEGNTMSSTYSMSLYRRKEMRKGARKVEMEEIKALVKWKKCHYLVSGLEAWGSEEKDWLGKASKIHFHFRFFFFLSRSHLALKMGNLNI